MPLDDYSKSKLQYFKYMQRGLVYPSPHAIYALVYLKDSKKYKLENIKLWMKLIYDWLNNHAKGAESKTTVVVGVSLDLWKEIMPSAMLPPGFEFDDSVLENSNNTFKNSKAHLWFHVKGESKENCEKLWRYIESILGNNMKEAEIEYAQSNTNSPGGVDGKVIGGRFSEDLNNPSDPVSILKHTLITSEAPKHAGASYVLTQRAKFIRDEVEVKQLEQLEQDVGRKTDDSIVPSQEKASHIKASRVQDEHGNTMQILRLGLPFDLKGCGGLEKGIFFAGYAKSAKVLEHTVRNQIGHIAHHTFDRLLRNIKSDCGGVFYIPSLLDLSLDISVSNDFSTQLDAYDQWLENPQSNWQNFPGMDWERLARHYRKASPNGFMYYNHRHFMWRMATMSNEEKEKYMPPSLRVLSLLENSFSRWEDNWYINRKQEELGSIKDNIPTSGIQDAPEHIRSLPISLRKAWADLLTINKYTSDKYGYRGKKLFPNETTIPPYPYFGHHEPDPEHGTVKVGADTYRIQPDEIIVGGMENCSLGQGRYVMTYLNPAEKTEAFNAGLSEASGVGHVIPDFKKLLDKGVYELQLELDAYVSKNTDGQRRKDFYTASKIALRSITYYCQNYACLASRNAESYPLNSWERKNLLEIEARLDKIATQKPETFLEAVQLIFVLHSCLHLTGEPTALGRLDQLLIAYYEADLRKGILTKEKAQEIIDAFFVKLSEKVQPNRMNVEDHQPQGYIAMSGTSGAYPQGGAINQWIQQLTVGGTIADNNLGPGAPAYNDVTMLCLRAIRRLPLNAPCISLRMRPDIPDEYLEEAAKGILSGGAHPILLSDPHFIPGLKASGDDVGGREVKTRLGEKWNTDVSLASARNYACDGCYEPQFPGENWFSLGGFPMLQPLECTLNSGRTYSLEGPGYLKGQRLSYDSPPPNEIESFDDFLNIFFQHFKTLNDKATLNQLRTYGVNSKYCPSPLLSIFVNGCLEKGLDYYSGGARYNIYGPCYVGLSTTINSLWAVKTLVYEQNHMTLDELLECLICNWGHDMKEPFVDSNALPSDVAAKADKYNRWRALALALPRYGRGNSDVDTFGDQILNRVAEVSENAFKNPIDEIKERLIELGNLYGTQEHPFGFQIQPGSGTFENHVEMGAWNAASPDGRLSGQTIESDLSPAPSVADKPVDHQQTDFLDSLKGYGQGSHRLTDGAAVDFNIDENFPLDELVKILREFSKGLGPNVLTITCSSPGTFQEAKERPEKFNLLRVRTGGWSEHFITLFRDKQEQHQRRPLSTVGSTHSTATSLTLYSLGQKATQRPTSEGPNGFMRCTK